MTRSSATPGFRMIGRKPTKKNKKNVMKDKKKKLSINDSDENQLTSPKVKGKKKENEFIPCEHVRETNFDEEVNEEIPSPSSKENEKPKASHQEKTRRVPLILDNALFKEKIKYDVIGHLKCIPVSLSVYDGLQMLNELRRALIQALMEPDDYKDQVD
ncbi:hypothetical protein V2J09_004497 [Rumex salicifolius]